MNFKYILNYILVLFISIYYILLLLHNFNDIFPISRKPEYFGNSKTRGEALEHRTHRQSPKLNINGINNFPKLK